MRQMEELTKVNGVPCIQFRPQLPADGIYIIIQNGTGCSAYVGFVDDVKHFGKSQLLFLPYSRLDIWKVMYSIVQ